MLIRSSIKIQIYNGKTKKLINYYYAQIIFTHDKNISK